MSGLRWNLNLGRRWMWSDKKKDIVRMTPYRNTEGCKIQMVEIVLYVEIWYNIYCLRRKMKIGGEKEHD